jgi:hypothetical protein
MAKRVKVETAKVAEPEVKVAEPVQEAAAATADENTVTVYDELLDVCQGLVEGFKSQGKNETDQQFFARMISVMSEIPEPAEGEVDQFEELPQGVRDWYNAAGEAINGGKLAPAPDGFVTVSQKAKTNGAAAADKPAKVAKEPAPPKEPRVTGQGVIGIGRKTIIENMGKTSDEIKAMVKAKFPDMKDSTFSAVWTDTMSTVKLVQELGHWR